MFKKQRNKGLIINLKFYRGKLATVTQENGCFFSLEYFNRAAFRRANSLYKNQRDSRFSDHI